MAICNRDLDVSEQWTENGQQLATSTGVSYPVLTIAQPVTVQAAYQYAAGLSGTPTGKLSVTRFVVGAGATTFDITGALTAVAYSTSGLQSFSMLAAGNSLLNLQADDVVLYVTAGTNAALAQARVDIVFQKTQDILSWF